MSKQRNKNYDYDDYDEEDEYYEYYEEDQEFGSYEISNSQKEKYLSGYKKQEKEQQKLGNFIDNSSKKKISKDDTEIIKKSLPRFKERLKSRFTDQEMIDAFRLNEYNESDTLNYLFNVAEEREKNDKKKKFEHLVVDTKSKTSSVNISTKPPTKPMTFEKQGKLIHTHTSEVKELETIQDTSSTRKVHTSFGLGRGRGVTQKVVEGQVTPMRPIESEISFFQPEPLKGKEHTQNFENVSQLGKSLCILQQNKDFVSQFFQTHTPESTLPSLDVKRYQFDEPSPDDLLKLSLEGKVLTKGHDVTPIKKKESVFKERKEVSPISPGPTILQGVRKAPPKDTEKQRVNVVVIGHVDAGKSTLMGHILFEAGVIDQKTIHKYEKESQQMGKATFHFAWVLDEQEEERQRGITMDIGVRYFETDLKSVTILDAPGHRDFIPNMINGTAQADFAILVVDSMKNAFESGFQDGGQSKEHLILARSLGISKFIVAVNKLDKSGWSKDRFDEIQGLLTGFMKQIGINSSNVIFIPCSGLGGDNLITKSKNIDWYSGPTIFEAVNQMEPGKRPTDKGLRISISDVFKSTVTGITIAGKVESGTMTSNDKISLMPSDTQCQVKTILRNKKMVKTCYAGDTVEFGVSGIDIQNIQIGQVICETFDRIPITNKFRARIITFDLDIPLIKGAEVMFHYQNINIPATVYKMYTLMNKNLEVVQKKPKAIIKNQTAEVQIRTSVPICVELFNEYKAFGRFMLRSRGKTVAAGMVTKLSRQSKKKPIKLVL